MSEQTDHVKILTELRNGLIDDDYLNREEIKSFDYALNAIKELDEYKEMMDVMNDVYLFINGKERNIEKGDDDRWHYCSDEASEPSLLAAYRSIKSK